MVQPDVAFKLLGVCSVESTEQSHSHPSTWRERYPKDGRECFFLHQIMGAWPITFDRREKRKNIQVITQSTLHRSKATTTVQHSRAGELFVRHVARQLIGDLPLHFTLPPTVNYSSVLIWSQEPSIARQYQFMPSWLRRFIYSTTYYYICSTVRRVATAPAPGLCDTAKRGILVPTIKEIRKLRK